MTPARGLPLLDGQSGRRPARNDASRLVARSAEAAMNVHHVGVAGLHEQLASVLRPSAGLAPDDERRGRGKVALDGGDELWVGQGLAGARIEEDDRDVTSTRRMAGLELGLGAHVEVDCGGVLLEQLVRLAWRHLAGAHGSLPTRDREAQGKRGARNGTLGTEFAQDGSMDSKPSER